MTTSSRRLTGPIKLLHLLVLLMLVSGGSVLAQHGEPGEGGEDDRNWMLMLGPGVGMQPKYSGSDKMRVVPIPFIMGRYETTQVDFFIDITEGIGLALKWHKEYPANVSLAVSWADGRDNNEVSLLKGTADVKASVQVIGGLELPLPLGKFASHVRYYPLSAEYDEVGRPDHDYTGFVVDLDWKHEGWVKFPFLMLQVKTGVSWVNADYAQAFYQVAYPTAQLPTFEAGKGLRDVHLELTSITMFSERIGIGLLGQFPYLVGDAADSPLTKRKLQPFFGAFAFWRF